MYKKALAKAERTKGRNNTEFSELLIIKEYENKRKTEAAKRIRVIAFCSELISDC